MPPKKRQKKKDTRQPSSAHSSTTFKNPDTPSRDESNRPVYLHKRRMEDPTFQERLAMARHPTALWEEEFHAGLKRYQKALDKKFRTTFINKFHLISESDGYMINFIIKKLLESVSHDDIKKLEEVKEYMETDARGATKVNFILVSMGPIMEKHIKRAKKMPRVLKDMAKKGTGEDDEVEYLKMRGKEEALKLYDDADKGLRKMTGRVKSPIDMAGAPGLGRSIDEEEFNKVMLNRPGGRRKKKYTKRKRRRRRTKKKRRKRNLKKRTRRRRRKSKRRRRR